MSIVFSVNKQGTNSSAIVIIILEHSLIQNPVKHLKRGVLPFFRKRPTTKSYKLLSQNA